MGYVTVAADNCLRVDVNSTDMGDVETAANSGLRIETHLHHNFGEHVSEKIDYLQGDTNQDEGVRLIQPVAEPVDRNRPDRRVQPQLLPLVAHRFVTCDIF